MKNHIKLPPLTDRQKEIITGSMLGDAYLHWLKDRENLNSKFVKGQSKLDTRGTDKIQYMDWHFGEMFPHSSKLSSSSVAVNEKLFNSFKKKSYDKYVFTTHCHPIYTELEREWYKYDENGEHILINNKRIKIIPPDIKLTPLSVCVWFMDDGFAYAKDANAIFCTHGFTSDECEFLVKRLKEDVRIFAKVRLVRQKWKGLETTKPVIYVGRNSYFDLINLIKPYVKWDCLQYKLDTTTYDKLALKGETHPNAKITEDIAKEIFNLRSEGLQHKEIANLKNLSQAAVTMILNGKRWPHLKLCQNPTEKPRASLEMKQKVKELFLLGETRQNIAKQTGVGIDTVGRIIRKLEEKQRRI